MKTSAPALTDDAPAAELVDVHSYARQLEARTTHVELDWTVDFERRELRGSATLSLALAPGAQRCVLDTRDLAIEGVADLQGRALEHRLGSRDPVLGAPLTVELP